ncbi:MAG: hypothetical protein Q9M89_06025 [Persephonella sp.]|nr:hypothetical protein [Persephonella sp.]
MNFLKKKAEKNNLKIIRIKAEKHYFLVQIINKKITSELFSLAPQVAPLGIVNLVIYDLGDGTGIVGNNPYLWDIVIDSKRIDEIAQDYSEFLSDLLDSIYWDYKKEKEMLSNALHSKSKKGISGSPLSNRLPRKTRTTPRSHMGG